MHTLHQFWRFISTSRAQFRTMLICCCPVWSSCLRLWPASLHTLSEYNFLIFIQQFLSFPKEWFVLFFHICKQRDGKGTMLTSDLCTLSRCSAWWVRSTEHVVCGRYVSEKGAVCGRNGDWEVWDLQDKV